MASNPGSPIPRTADAVIIGGGVIGCAIQYHMARLGVSNTVLLERDVLGSGSTGRSQAICRMHYSNPITTELAWQSLQVFADFDARVGGASGFVNTGYLVVVNEADQGGLERNVAMQQELGVPSSLVSRDDLASLAPMVTLYDDERAAWEPQSGYADPYQVTVSYAARAQESGARIMTRNPASGIETNGDRVQAVITTSGDRIATDTVVVAAGPWSGQVLAGVGVDAPLMPVRHQVATVARPVEVVPHHPTVGDISQSFSFRPDGSNCTTMGFGDDDEQSDPEVYPQGVDITEAASARARLARRVPGMADAYYRGGWSGLFTTTPDWHPILDAVPGMAGLYCAIGFSGHGFKLSPAIGKSVAELVLEGRARDVDLSPLRFTRFDEGDLLESSYRYRVLA
ncbi:MAG: FAD-dependent oxidoreductase [Chloroflexi bacterium]|nr:FAD-dependent oxidoreductase [Chloroflexota bacterium]